MLLQLLLASRVPASVVVELGMATVPAHGNCSTVFSGSTLALWGKGGPLDRWYADAGGPLGIWRDWANDVTGHPIEGGHFFPEHNPRETAVKLRAFFSA